MTKLTHLMELLITLQYKELTTASELAQILDVNKKTVYRYIETLLESNIPVKTKKGRYGGFYLDSGFFMKQPRLEKEEMEALIMAADMLAGRECFAFERQLRNAVSKIKNVTLKDNAEMLDFKEDVKFEIKNIGSLEDIDDNMVKINKSMNRSRVMEVSYYSINKNSSSRFKFEPYSIFYKSGEWHMVGYSDAKKGIAVLTLSRIKEIKLTDEMFVKPANFSVGDYIKELREKVEGDKDRIRIRFSKKCADFISEVKWHPTQKIETLDDGNILFEVVLNQYGDLKRWIFGFGADAEVLEPSSLRNEIAEEIEMIYKSYRRDKDM